MDKLFTTIALCSFSFFLFGNNVKSVNQLLAERIIENINEDLEALQLRLEALETRLLAQFAAMDAIVGQLNSTSSFLTQQFEIISNINNQSNR